MSILAHKPMVGPAGGLHHIAGAIPNASVPAQAKFITLYYTLHVCNVATNWCASVSGRYCPTPCVTSIRYTCVRNQQKHKARASAVLEL